MMEAKMRTLSIGLAVGALSCFAADSSLAQQEAKDIIAAQIRSQGYACDHPARATRDAAASKPYGVVWRLTCENSTYRVTLVPNLAAKVELIDQDAKAQSGQ
jgi:hypothetical protein